MRPFTTHTGLVCPLDRPNVDTDQIIPKQFLKRIERTGFGNSCSSIGVIWTTAGQSRFRAQPAGVSRGEHFFGPAEFRLRIEPGARPLGLEDYGFRAIIAPSFADIFYNNCFKNGMLPVRLDEAADDDLFHRAAKQPGYKLTVDLETAKFATITG